MNDEAYFGMIVGIILAVFGMRNLQPVALIVYLAIICVVPLAMKLSA